MTGSAIETNLSEGAGKNSARLAGLDALRGLAVSLVLIYHLAGATFVPNDSYGMLGKVADGCWIGVDIFFVLSGFLITSGLIGDRVKPGYYKRFYIKRAFRLLPIYYFALLVFLSLPLIRRMHPSLGLIFCYVFYVQNLAMATGYWIRGSAHLWSLAVEEQFYLVWPWISRRLRDKSLLKLSLAVFTTSFLLRAGLRYFTPIQPWTLYTLTVTRLDGIALGAAVALLFGEPWFRGWIARWVRLVSVISLACVVGLFVLIPTGSDNLDAVTYLPLAVSIWAATAVIWIIEFDPAFLRSSRMGKVLQRYGLYSYSIYVFHPFVITLLHIREGKVGVDLPTILRSLSFWPAVGLTTATFIVFFAGSYAFGSFVFRFVESPLFRLRQRVLARVSGHSRPQAKAMAQSGGT